MGASTASLPLAVPSKPENGRRQALVVYVLSVRDAAVAHLDSRLPKPRPFSAFSVRSKSADASTPFPGTPRR